VATYTKLKFSGSTDGRGIKVSASATPGTTIHTSSATGTDYDEIWLYAYNSNSTIETLTIEFGGVSVPGDNIKVSLPSQVGLFTVVPGIPIKGNASPNVISAFSTTGSVVSIFGYVNRISA
jgi:hypothetical protein